MCREKKGNCFFYLCHLKCMFDCRAKLIHIDDRLFLSVQCFPPCIYWDLTASLSAIHTIYWDLVASPSVISTVHPESMVWMWRASLQHCNVLSLQGGLLAELTLWDLKGICPGQRGLWRAKFSQVLKGLKMPWKQQILEQHQSAKPSQFKCISPKDLAQLNKKNILHQITFRIHTSPVPLGIWSFTVAVLTE